MPARLEARALDPQAALAEFARAHESGSFGATASFIGTMRNRNEGEEVVSMELEHYPEMTQPQLEDICRDAIDRFDILDALIVHRVGHIEAGEPIVLAAAVSMHRAAAFDACRFLLEALKQRGTFWKKEHLANGETRWVERNTPG
ncbi:MAG: molybdopterin converting factor [Gammaproteobacteria bacterium]|nr:MAG: molybdopterin converting factor [Gammaproteobacteria bacterium]